MRLVWLPAALDSLEEIYHYIARDNSDAAAKLTARIRSAGESLRLHPRMGKLGSVEQTRDFVIAGTSYILCYRMREDRVEILHVRHGAQQWPKSLQ